jgi:two-component system response regulator YesN
MEPGATYHPIIWKLKAGGAEMIRSWRKRNVYSKMLIILLSITIIPSLLISFFSYRVSIDNAKQQAENYSVQFLNLIRYSNDHTFNQVRGFIYGMMVSFNDYSSVIAKI